MIHPNTLPIDPLTGSKVIGKLPPRFRDQIWQMARPVHLKKGETLFVQDDPGDALYALESGSVEISVIGTSGKKLSLNIMRPPDVFGEIAALDGGPRTATATAREASTIYQVRRSRLIAAMDEHPEFAAEVVQILCERIRWISQQVEDLALLGLEGRLARRLLILNSKISDGEGCIRISQSELADFLGTTRETVNKTLQLWCSSNLIDTSRGMLKIKNRSGIQELAGRK